MKRKRLNGKFISTGPATCHPKRKAHGRGLCASCYQQYHLDSNPKALKRKKLRAKVYLADGRANHANWKTKIKKRFGLTEKEFLYLLGMQNGLCAICKRTPEHQKCKRKLSVDHDHKTNKVRGLLCDCCNRALGLFQDDINVLSGAIRYLKKHGQHVTKVLTEAALLEDVVLKVNTDIQTFLHKYFRIKDSLGLKTQQEVARKTDIGTSQISRIEAGQKPQYATLAKLAKGFGVDVTQLI